MYDIVYLSCFTSDAILEQINPKNTTWYILFCRPEANSMTAQRARDGEAKVRQEVCDLCDIIFNLGVTSSEGRSKIQFGELFQVKNN